MIGPPFHRNNLDRSVSPYLRQHAGDPIHWQEWSAGALEEARRSNRHILVSIGYSTCHWCHVMAGEAFADREVARYLNDHFVAIKVDREQRPDIDHHFMAFIAATRGGGGWPLNVFLTPQGEPIAAFTYIPLRERFGTPSLPDLLRAVRRQTRGVPFRGPETPADDAWPLPQVVAALLSGHDAVHGGFGSGPKFPPHCSLLLLLSHYDRYRDPRVEGLLAKTLAAMAERGLHDHLQGGFFRYCVDAAWTIPHFEKMLYDQAMMLWVYSWGLAVLKREEYREVIAGLLRCLEETFRRGGLYISAHDADTHHREGATYTWTLAELERLLEPPELERLRRAYDIREAGNFEEANHLVRLPGAAPAGVEEKLLRLRRQRTQPFADHKIITSWNALAGVGLVMAWRATGDAALRERARGVLDGLLQLHRRPDGGIAHSSLDGVVQAQGFLEDAAALLLLATCLHEERDGRAELLRELRPIVLRFRGDGWNEAAENDFRPVAATGFDHPIPSSAALAEMALLRTALLLGEEPPPVAAGAPGREFGALAAFIADGHWHIVHAPRLIAWSELPLNAVQVPGTELVDCFEGACRRRP